MLQRLKPSCFFRLPTSKRVPVTCRVHSRSFMQVIPIPVLSDNYCYLIIDTNTREAAVVDPAEPKKVLERLDKENVKLVSILTTHHHWDHAGGNEEVHMRYPELPIYGGDDRIPKLSNKVAHRDSFSIGGLKVTVHFTPCHTTGHVLYFVEDPSGDKSPALFSGDTLFVGGCGRFFEGTPEQMYHALMNVIAQLPPDTNVYCGHEYTVKNLQFAKSLEPDNKDVERKLQESLERRSRNEFTIPSTVAEELKFNPFMRVNTPGLKKAVGLDGASDIEVMQKVRSLKDKF